MLQTRRLIQPRKWSGKSAKWMRKPILWMKVTKKEERLKRKTEILREKQKFWNKKTQCGSNTYTVESITNRLKAKEMISGMDDTVKEMQLPTINGGWWEE